MKIRKVLLFRLTEIPSSKDKIGYIARGSCTLSNKYDNEKNSKSAGVESIFIGQDHPLYSSIIDLISEYKYEL